MSDEPSPSALASDMMAGWLLASTTVTLVGAVSTAVRPPTSGIPHQLGKHPTVRELDAQRDNVKVSLPLAQGAFGRIHRATVGEGSCIAKRAENSPGAAAYLASEAAINQHMHVLARGSCHLAPFVGRCSIGWMDHLIWEACPGVEHSLDWYLEPTVRTSDLAHALGVVEGPMMGALAMEQEAELARKLLEEMLLSLMLLHSSGVLHRDVKPQNWLVDARTHSLRVIDFGASCLIEDLQRQQAVATKAYAPPESLRSDCPWTYDVYSAALVWLRSVLPSCSSRQGFDDMRSALHAARSHVQIGDLLAGAADGRATAVHADAWRLVEAMLAPEPLERATACQALCSPYIGASPAALEPDMRQRPTHQ